MEKNMKENFLKLERRVVDCLNDSDLEMINYLLSKIDDSTLVSGVGGSSIVADFASKILCLKNHIVTRCHTPRDFRYMVDLGLFKNVFACSYSGNNFGVDLAFCNNLKHYLFSSKARDFEDIINLTYTCSDPEKSFISIGATLIPCSILLSYYLDGDIDRVIDSFSECNFDFDVNCDCFEIFSGIETSTASKFLESTMVESGIGIPIVHDKYDYCHGRSILSTVYKDNIAIYFNSNTEFDKEALDVLSTEYKNIIVIDYKNDMSSLYQLLIKCMFLCKYIAEQKKKDLSGVDYGKAVKKLYKFNKSI